MKTKLFDVVIKETTVRSFDIEAEDEDSAIRLATQVICDPDEAVEHIESSLEDRSMKVKIMKFKNPRKKPKPRTLGNIWSEKALKKSIVTHLAERGVRKEWARKNIIVIC
jgi:hypothetical protein